MRTLILSLSFLVLLPFAVANASWTCQIKKAYMMEDVNTVQTFDIEETFTLVQTKEQIDANVLWIKGGFFGEQLLEFALMSQEANSTSYIQNSGIFFVGKPVNYPADNTIEALKYTFSSSTIDINVGHQGVCFRKRKTQ